jgi:hypothetical protein
MQTQAMVSRLLRCCAPLMHAARWQVLNDVTLSALCGRPLTLAEIYTLAEGLAKPWEADAVPVRIDHLVTALPQPNGSSTDWSVSFYLAAAKGGMQIDTGDGKLYCSTFRGEPAGYIPALRPDLTRDGAALYTLAEKHGQALLGKGYGVSIYLWADSETHHAMWHVKYIKRDGSESGVRLVVDANTGALEDIVKH